MGKLRCRVLGMASVWPATINLSDRSSQLSRYRTPILLRPDGLYGTRPASGGNKAAKLKAIRDALRTARRVWLATDCDREGQLIGQEILEHYEYRGEVLRVLFTAQDPQTIREAFGREGPQHFAYDQHRTRFRCGRAGADHSVTK